jgi:hypothetical protein
MYLLYVWAPRLQPHSGSSGVSSGCALFNYQHGDFSIFVRVASRLSSCSANSHCGFLNSEHGNF